MTSNKQALEALEPLDFMSNKDIADAVKKHKVAISKALNQAEMMDEMEATIHRLRNQAMAWGVLDKGLKYSDVERLTSYVEKTLQKYEEMNNG